MKKFMMTALATAMISSVAMAAEELSLPNTFVQGENAVAAEVNANFEALIEAINDNAEAIAELRSASNTLSVAGKTYQVFQYGVEIGTNKLGSDLAIEEFVVTFNEDESIDVEGTKHSGKIEQEFISEDESYTYVDVRKISDAGSNATWSRDGNVVTINSPGEEGGTKFLIAPGARTLIDIGVFTDGSNATDGTYFETELLVGVQVYKKCPPEAAVCIIDNTVGAGD